MLLRAEQLHFDYGDRPALADVSLQLAAGEVVALLGANGSGKSTLIRLLLGQLDRSAAVCWDDRKLIDCDRRQLARTVAYLPQSPSFDAEQTVLDVLRLGRTPYGTMFGVERQTDAEVIHAIAAQLDLLDLLPRRIDTLSGGQRQRVFVGRCLVQQPRALLLDEPNTYLDLRHQVALCQLLSRLSKSQSIGVLMAVHDVNLATTFADRVVLLKDGRVTMAGDIADLDAAALSDAYGVTVERVMSSTGRPAFLPVPGFIS